MDRNIERSNHLKVLRRVARLVAPLGLVRCRSTFFVRRRQFVLEFVHLHKFSFGPKYRVHLGIRVLNDTRSVISLNGPDSDPHVCRDSPNGHQYRLRYGPDEASVDHCANEICSWCQDIGLPWFERFQDSQELLTDPESPLCDEEKSQLRLALESGADPNLMTASETLFGIHLKR